MTSTEEQLAKTQQELENLKAEYEEFAYIVSHDLSGPLRTIEGFAAIIAKKHTDNFDEKTLDHFNHIISGAKTSKEMLAALLGYSRLNTETEAFAECDCNKVVNQVKKQLSSMVDESGASIYYDNLPVVLADKNQMSLLFFHLLHNALLYRKVDTSPEIHISYQEKDNTWEFSIHDNGIGIKSNLMEKIFKVLRRGTSNKYYSGMGMGLAIAKKIVQRHGGELSLATDLGNGSTFHFTIAKA